MMTSKKLSSLNEPDYQYFDNQVSCLQQLILG